MKRTLLRPILLGGAALLAALTTACNDDESSFEPVLTNPALESCDSDRRPVVAVHGFLAAGDTWAKFAKRFAGIALPLYLAESEAPVIAIFE